LPSANAQNRKPPLTLRGESRLLSYQITDRWPHRIRQVDVGNLVHAATRTASWYYPAAAISVVFTLPEQNLQEVTNEAARRVV